MPKSRLKSFCIDPEKKMKKKVIGKMSVQAGFSLMELLIVIAIIMIMSGIMLFYLTAHQKLYKVDDESLQIADILQEARQRALAQREPLRVEINTTTNMVTLYNENKASDLTDDIVIKRFTLTSTDLVKYTTRPAQITVNPPEPMPVPNAVFKSSVYTPSSGQNVCTIRFLSNGSATDAGTNTGATDAVQTGVSLFVWSPKKGSTTESDQARAVTVLGATGAIRMWEWDAAISGTNKWKDSRKSVAY
jgi:prepilin-type N-terminal cleavage/methylation domain-containing protein